jgi:AGZA family xanthine/uracil permease-like MFS transporter
MAFRAFADRSNEFIGRSTFGRVFRLEGSGHEKEIQTARFWTEIRAGITTFFTMYDKFQWLNISYLSD